MSEPKPAIAILMKQELLGDAITRIPAVRALRCAFPDHRVVGLYRTQTVWNNSLARLRHDFYDDIRIGTPAEDGARAIRDELSKIPNLAAVLDFHSNGRVFASYRATAGMAVRYVANIAGFGLRRGISMRPEIRPVSNARRYHRAAELIAGRSLPFHARLDIFPDAKLRADRLLADIGDFVCLAPGPAIHPKFWSKEGWVTVANHIRTLDLTPVFLLGPNEHAEREWIVRGVPDAVIVDAAAAGSAEQLPWVFLAVADRAVAAVAYEGGIGHLIATRDIPILTIAGPTDPERWRPVTRYHWIERPSQARIKPAASIATPSVIAQAEEMIDFAKRSLHRAGDVVPELRREAV